jgi:hypothetical protein
VWQATLDPPSLLQIAESGAVLDVITELAVDGNTRQIPIGVAIDVETPDILWIAGYDPDAGPGVFRIDLAATRVQPFRAPATVEYAGNGIGFVGTGKPFAAAGPDAGRRMAWIIGHGFLATPSVLRLLESTGPSQYLATDLLDVTSDEEHDAASPPAGGDFCFGRRLFSGAVELYRATPGPPALLTSTTSFGVALDRHVRGVSASSTPGGEPDEDLCWFAIYDPALGLSVLAYDAGGSNVRSFHDPDGDALDIAAVGPGDVWLLRKDLSATNPDDVRPTLLHFDGPGGTLTKILPPTTANQFVPF